MFDWAAAAAVGIGDRKHVPQSIEQSRVESQEFTEHFRVLRTHFPSSLKVRISFFFYYVAKSTPLFCTNQIFLKFADKQKRKAIVMLSLHRKRRSGIFLCPVSSPGLPIDREDGSNATSKEQQQERHQ